MALYASDAKSTTRASICSWTWKRGSTYQLVRRRTVLRAAAPAVPRSPFPRSNSGGCSSRWRTRMPWTGSTRGASPGTSAAPGTSAPASMRRIRSSTRLTRASAEATPPSTPSTGPPVAGVVGDSMAGEHTRGPGSGRRFGPHPGPAPRGRSGRAGTLRAWRPSNPQRPRPPGRPARTVVRPLRTGRRSGTHPPGAPAGGASPTRRGTPTPAPGPAAAGGACSDWWGAPCSGCGPWDSASSPPSSTTAISWPRTSPPTTRPGR